MTTSSAFGSTEILQIADAVAREKNIPKDTVLEAMKSAIEIAGRRKYGHEHVIRAEIDSKTGEIQLYRERKIVEEVEDYHSQISLADALEKDPEAELGGVISELLPPIDLGRVAAQTAKQVIVQKVREAERERQYEDYKSRIGEIVNGTVKRIEYNNITVELGNAEAFLARDQIVRNETFRVNDRIRAYITDVRSELTGPQIFLSRVCNEFMAELFKQEVPEIYDGVIEIKSVAREPGSRAKIAVFSPDSGIDPVGSCVGIRGSRVQAVINELQGEKIDIVPWSADTATFVVKALAPAEASKVVIDEDKGRIEVVVPDDQLSIAIGRRGQNVRLASYLTSWRIDVMTEDEESKRRQEEFSSYTQIFMEALNVEEMIAQLLATEGFCSVEEIAMVTLEDLAQIEGFDENIAQALSERAKAFLEQRDALLGEKYKELGLDAALIALPGLSSELAVSLGENGIKTLDDLGDLSRDEVRELLPDLTLSNDAIDRLIMKAREHWFDEEKGDDANDDATKEA